MAYTVLVVEDSPLFARMLTEFIEQIEDFKVVGIAKDPFEARDKIKEVEPDLITLDINMPKMDGLSFLKNLMRLHPMPVIIVSGHSSRCDEAFDEGAIGFVEKPKLEESPLVFAQRLSGTLQSFNYLYEHYKQKKPAPTQPQNQEESASRLHPDALLPKNQLIVPGKKLIAIGSSTGGTEALAKIFASLRAPLCPIVMVQHIPYGFSRSLADRLSALGPIKVVEVTQSMPLEDNTAYLASGRAHLVVEKRASSYFVAPLEGAKISYHKPSADILFRSVCNSVGRNAIGVILTGMGDDGVIGLGELFAQKAHTIAQDEASCVVYGMPKKAVEAKAISEVLPLGNIAKRLVELGAI